MKPTIILDSIKNAGLTLSLLPGDLLKVEPKEKITDEIRQAIREHKKELVSILSCSQEPGPDTPARTWTPGTPFTCSCGFSTGWSLNDQPLCPTCYHARLYGTDTDPPRQDTGEPPRQIVYQAMPPAQ